MTYCQACGYLTYDCVCDRVNAPRALPACCPNCRVSSEDPTRGCTNHDCPESAELEETRQ